MFWYINFGEDMRRDQKITFPFVRRLTENYSPSNLIFENDLLECSLLGAAKYPKKGVTSTNCSLVANLTTISSGYIKSRVDVGGIRYFDVEYNLIVSTKTVIMKFSLEIDGRKISNVETSYD
ncbi:MAG: hypothetical protein HETSPECPRED_002852 [Heterodermia speciosa]|uniref:Uncharacterized protein n=1 Tax=Heterodermia speciosa TaxID=116794 RepID=A0A8H3J5D3_9LECA|nr:MAG: hypothetical protein HETSPECPRED_002852 [Heterodermia speciosa]